METNNKPQHPITEPIAVPEVLPEIKPKTPWQVPGPKVNPKPKGKVYTFSFFIGYTNNKIIGGKLK